MAGAPGRRGNGAMARLAVDPINPLLIYPLRVSCHLISFSAHFVEHTHQNMLETVSPAHALPAYNGTKWRPHTLRMGSLAPPSTRYPALNPQIPARDMKS